MTTTKVSSTIEALKNKFNRQLKHEAMPTHVAGKLNIEETGKSKGQLFKEKWGFSKTFKRNMQKAGLNPFTVGDRIVYRKQRKLK